MDETERYKNVDFTEPLTRLLCSQLLEQISKLPDEQIQTTDIETLIKNTVALTRAVAYKKNVDAKTSSLIENGAEQFQGYIFEAVSKERPELYNMITISGSETVFGNKSMGYVYDNGYGIKNGFILDAPNGTGTAYAEGNGIRLKGELLRGDVNADGEFTISDAVLLQKWLLAVPDTKLANWRAADLCEDNRLDVFDLCLMKRELIAKQNY